MGLSITKKLTDLLKAKFICIAKKGKAADLPSNSLMWKLTVQAVAQRRKRLLLWTMPAPCLSENPAIDAFDTFLITSLITS